MGMPLLAGLTLETGQNVLFPVVALELKQGQSLASSPRMADFHALLRTPRKRTKTVMLLLAGRTLETGQNVPCPAENTEEENQNCDAPACWTEFSAWSPCEGMCGSPGSQTRSRSCIEPSEGGLPCPAESTESEDQECDTTGLWAVAAP